MCPIGVFFVFSLCSYGVFDVFSCVSWRCGGMDKPSAVRDKSKKPFIFVGLEERGAQPIGYSVFKEKTMPVTSVRLTN